MARRPIAPRLALLALLSPAAAAAELRFEHLRSIGDRIDREPGATNYPSGVTVDPKTGDVFVMDLLNNRIQRFDKANKPVAMWDCRQALGITVDPETGDVWAAMWKSHKVIKYSKTGQVLLELGTGQVGDAPGEFNGPHDVSVDPRSGDLYVLDTFNKRVQVFSRDGKHLRSFSGDFIQPFGIAVHPKGEFLIIANTANRELLKYGLDGQLIERWKRPGSAPGELRWPRNVAVDAAGFIYVADTDNERAQKLDKDGKFVQFIQGPNDRAHGSFHPRAIEVNPATGEVYAAAAYAQRIDRFDKTGKHVASFGQHERDAPVFNTLKDVLVHPNGDIYGSDWMDHRWRRFGADGSYKAAYDLWIPEQTDHDGKPFPPTFASDPATGMWVAKEDQGFPGAMDHDADGHIWMIRGSMHYDDDPRLQADWVVRAFTPDGRFVRGFGHADFPRNARMRGIAVDRKSGHVYVSNTFGNRVQKFDLQGNPVWTYGKKGSGDGQLILPAGIDVHRGTGEVYVVDQGNNRVVVLSPEGQQLRTFGGPGEGPGQFRFDDFSNLAVDERGYVFIADTGNNRVHVVDLSGAFVKAYGEQGFGGQGRYNGLSSVEVHDGKLYVADNAGHEIEVYQIHYP
jgi:DNA-binding beta-propeller fold protein YncE